MRKLLLATVFTAAAVISSSYAHAQSQPFPCSQVSASEFRDAFNAPVSVLAIGSVEWATNNVCSILLDTTAGRVRFWFTAGYDLENRPMWMKLRVEAVSFNTVPAYAPPPPPPAPMQPVTTTTERPDPAFTSFTAGKRDRLAWESFYASVVGDEKDGALWWSSQRSLKSPGSCSVAPSDLFRHGCEEAQAILGPSDVKRRIDPAYRAGFNSL